MSKTNTGKIVKIMGVVVDVHFTGKLPKIYEALEFVNGAGEKLVFEVQQHVGKGVVRAIAMGAVDGMKRGDELVATGEPIQVPVGKEVLGRMTNVTGDPIDGRGEIKAKQVVGIQEGAE